MRSPHSLRVRFVDPPTATTVARLSDQLWPTTELVFATRNSPPDPNADYDILVGRSFSDDDLSLPRSLRKVIVPFAGVPAETREQLLRHPQIEVHVVRYASDAVAEMAIALLFAAAKNLITADSELRKGHWATTLPLLGLTARTALVLGYGAIGSRTARLCAGLGLKVRIVRRRPTLSTDQLFDVHGVNDLRDLLTTTDVLMVCLPLTDETRGLIGPTELALLPPTAVVINVGRAEVIDEGSLYQALRDQTIFAAGMDVWYTEPGHGGEFVDLLPSHHAFHQLPNVVLSPHRAFRGPDADNVRIDALAKLLNLAALGAELPDRVDLVAGY